MLALSSPFSYLFDSEGKSFFTTAPGALAIALL